VTAPVAVAALLLATSTGGAGVQGKLAVLNAGSLAAPFQRALEAFRRVHPDVEPEQESAGSLEVVRRVTELGRPCDVLAVADWEVLPALVVPRHAAWYAVFGRNRLVIAYRDGAAGAADLATTPWWEVLLRPGIAQGRSDPDVDPAGYRALMAWRLAERHHHVPGLARRMEASIPPRNVRAKSIELVALVQAGELDYAWLYRSVAEEAGLRVHPLAPEVDLGDPALAEFYATVSVEVAGNRPGDRRTVRGLPILYGLTIPKGAPNPGAAEAFVAFLASDEGRAALRAAHFDPIDPPQANDPSALPATLRSSFVPLAVPPPVR
jgi:molybdate/tungstate transport system substrate-binding protein